MFFTCAISKFWYNNEHLLRKVKHRMYVKQNVSKNSKKNLYFKNRIRARTCLNELNSGF